MTVKTVWCVILIIVFFIPIVGCKDEIKSTNVNNKDIEIDNSWKSVSTVLPTRKKWKNICAYFNRYQPIKYRAILDKMNTEQLLGEVCVRNNKSDCPSDTFFFGEFYNMGIQKDDRWFNDLIEGNLRLEASLVDIDNDGIKELRLWFYGGTANCMKNYFWKKDSFGKYKFIDAKGYEGPREEGSGCNEYLNFVPYNKTIYTLNINSFTNDTLPGETPRIDIIMRGSESMLEIICVDRLWGELLIKDE